MDSRRMCPNCRAFITVDDKVCPYCDMQIGLRAIDKRTTAEAMAGFIEGDWFVTNVLLLINAGLYLATILFNSDTRNMQWEPTYNALLAFGGKRGFEIAYGLQWWRLITAGFLHGGIIHIAMNSYSLYQLGPLTDAVFGANRYIAIYIISTITGFAASMWWSPNTLSIGASAGIAGLIGAFLGLGLRERNSAVGQQAKRFIPSAVMLLALGFFGLPIDNAAHVGGFAGGFIVAYLAGPKGHARGDDFAWRTLAWVCIAVTGYAFFRMVQRLVAL